MKPEELTRTVALYQSTLIGFILASNYTAGEQDSRDYVRVSEPLTITFQPRAANEVMAAAVAQIDAQIVEAQQAMRILEQRKAELLALPAPEAV
jgi:hypothetical protein